RGRLILVRLRARAGLRARWESHAHDLIAAIDVDDLAGDSCGSVAGQKNSGGAKLGGIATAFQWRALLIMLQHRCKPADATRGQRLDGPGRDAVYPDFFWAEIVGKIAGAGFET